MFQPIRLGVANDLVTTQYHLKWDPPDNMAEFDLDHYELIVGEREINIDSSENDVIVSVGVGNLLSLNLTTVDKCGQKSESKYTSLDARSLLVSGLSTKVGCEPSTTSSVISSLSITVLLSVIITILSIAVAVLVVICVCLIYKKNKKNKVS